MSQTATQIALCSASLSATEAGAPEWIQLLPAPKNGRIETGDRRGPYLVGDLAALVEASMQAAEGRMPIDENHATDLAAPRGEPAPARGWIVEMQARADGLWGRVEWTDEGRKLVETHAYRGISPALAIEKATKRVASVLRASLVNKPNLRGLAALHQEEDMTFQQKLAEMLGLGADASEDDIAAAIKKALEGDDGDGETELNSELPKIAKALNLAEDADVETVLNAIEAAPKDKELVELQSEVATLTTELNAVKEASTRKDAEAYVDAEIKRGRAGLKPVRDRYIALHQKDPAEAQALIEAMPILNGTTVTTTALQSESADLDDPQEIALQASAYQKKRADEGVTIDFAAAVTAVQEGKK